jgi:pimeloyl-ACP methyl ester carboxylesterase
MPRMRGVRRWAKRIGLGIAVLLVAALAAGAAYQAIGGWRDARRFPQEGRSVALGAGFPDLTLNINCTGSGSPTVVLDSGLGMPAAAWDLVQPDVARFTRVCSYDRAGYGWSSAGPMPRTSGQIANELHALLAASGEPGPYVLVGHSFGGYNVRVYTARYPADVAGLVLVDASHEDQVRLESPAMRRADAEQQASLNRWRPFVPALIGFGVLRFMAAQASVDPQRKDWTDKQAYLQVQSKFVTAALSELEMMPTASADEVRASGALGDRPLVVLSAGQEPSGKDLPAGISLAELKAFRKAWIEDLQARQARLSTRGRQVVLPDSGHLIPVERPASVVAAIREVCDAVRVGTR